jgi:hypothetical protein
MVRGRGRAIKKRKRREKTKRWETGKNAVVERWRGVPNEMRERNNRKEREQEKVDRKQRATKREGNGLVWSVGGTRVLRE